MMKFFAVGSDKISDEARESILRVGGTIQPTNHHDISMVRFPEEMEILSSQGDHVHIALSENETLHFTRRWDTKDCSLDLCK